MLQQEVRILEEERMRLTREVAIKTEMEEGYAKRGAKQQVGAWLGLMPAAGSSSSRWHRQRPHSTNSLAWLCTCVLW